jgi:hypothetical protein
LYNWQGGPLPDMLANYTDTDGVGVIHYLEGVEHQYYCRVAFEPTAEPNWRIVPVAEGNLTKLLRDNYLILTIIRNVSLAYFAKVRPHLAAAEANSSLAKAAVASVREYLALVNKTPRRRAALLHAAGQLQGKECHNRVRRVRLESSGEHHRRAPPPPREGVVGRLIPNGRFAGGEARRRGQGGHVQIRLRDASAPAAG